MNKLTNIKQYRKGYVRALYGRHGRSTGINPGVMWPRKEELVHIKQYEAAFCPKLEDLIAENRAKKEAQLRARKEREEEILRNIEQLPGAFKSFFEKIEAKDKERQEFIRQKEALVEEVREILGFRAKPSDERFQKALAQREEEEIKAKKKEARKKRENIGLEEMLAGIEKSDKY
uniref:Large ribosomal subunit protein mL64 n=1 Tax=Aceria tosichella TaxID=561515 RepID=A0A6G1S8X6_9ACAR